MGPDGSTDLRWVKDNTGWKWVSAWKYKKTSFLGYVGYSSSIADFPIKCVNSKGITCEKQVFSWFYIFRYWCAYFNKSCFIETGHLRFFFCAHNNTLDVWITTTLIAYCDSWTVSTYFNFILNTKHVIAFQAFDLHL